MYMPKLFRPSALILLVSLLLPLGHGPLAAETATSGEDEITLVSWNIEWFPGRTRYARSAERRAHEAVVRKELQNIQPDILLAQELRGWEPFALACDAVTGLQPAVVSAFRSPYSGEYWQQQVGIASKLPATAAWSEPWRRGNDFEVVRGFSVTAIRIPGTYHLLLVYSVHLKSNLAREPEHVELNYKIRDESIRQLLEHIREMEEVAFEGLVLGVIVGGDLNTNHDGDHGDHVVALMEEAGFHNTWRDVPPEERATWRGSEQYEPTTFDYFFTKGLGEPRAVLLEISDEASDHWPVKLVIPTPSPED